MIKMIAALLLLGSFLHSPCLNAEPLDGQAEADRLIYAATRAIDDAWDAFHQAALGGTLASPEIQTSVEKDLFKSRELLRAARHARHQGDIDKVKQLTTQIHEIVANIVYLSHLNKE